jgi:uncharacterized membrane protein YtjA (UPF0391 family)
MLHYAIIFFIIALVAAALGVGGVAGISLQVGEILCVVFLVLAVIAWASGRRGPRA